MERSLDIRARILEEATRLFASQGFDGTSIQAISDAVGIRKPSVLYHFASKELLHQAVLDDVLARWNDVLPELLLAAAHEQRFDRVMEAITSFFTEDPDRARLLLREILDRPEEMRRRLSRFVRPWIDIVAEQLEKAKQKSLVRESIDPEAYAMNVISMVVAGIAIVESLAVVFRDDPENHPQDRFVAEMIRVARSSLYQHETSSEPAKALERRDG
jgi:TetR/AcrR family transcriptional regulator